MPGSRHGEDDLAQRLPARAAVGQRALLHLHRDVLDVAPHHPDHVRQVERDVEQDQPDVAVDPAQPDEQQEDRKDDDDGRDHPLRDDPDREVLPAGLETRDAVGGRRAEHHGDGRGHGGDDQAVVYGPYVAVLEQDPEDAKGRLFGEPDRRAGEDVARRLDRRNEEPVDGEEEEHQHHQREQEAPGHAAALAGEPARPAAGGLGSRRVGYRHRAISTRFKAKMTMIESRMITRKAIAPA